METVAFQMLGRLYSGNSIIKKDFFALLPVIPFIINAHIRMMNIATKYIHTPTQRLSPKNAPAKRAITGSLAPQGIKGARRAVALRSRSLRIVLHAITPGIAQPVPITKGITDLPESPTFLKMGSRTTVALAIYPQSSSKAIRKYITITNGRKPTTAPTPPIIPSTMIDASKGLAFSMSLDTHSPNISIKVTSPGTVSSFAFPSLRINPSAIHVPSQDCEIWNTRNITTANIGRPTHLLVSTASILSCLFLFLVKTVLSSTSFTMQLTNSKRFLSAISTVSLFERSMCF